MIRTPLRLTLAALLTAVSIPCQKNASGGPLHPQQACFDVQHYRLQLSIDPETRTIDGRLSMTAKVTRPTQAVFLDLDSRSLKVKKVSCGDQEIAFRHENDKIHLPLPKPMKVGDALVVHVDYGGAPRVAPRAPWDGGFTWRRTRGKPRAHWIATTCQTNGADLWWPCKDHPSDKPETMDLIITVPENLYCAANGRLQSDTKADGKRTFHWRIGVPINNYCVALNIAPYVVLERTYKSVTGEDVPAFFFALPQNAEKAKRVFPHFLDHLRFMEETCGPYPFRSEKYAVVETPHLGMEHQTIIAYGNGYPKSDDGYDWLHHHEMAHEWWGNLVTCRDWKDMWIHEGIGTYMQALYLEKLRGRDAYFKQMRGQRPFGTATVAPREIQDTQQIYQGHSIYRKGSWVMHTLRWLMGDEKFFLALRRMAYPDPKMEKVTDGSCVRFSDSDEIRAIAEKIHGAPLDWFFDVYLHQGELPRLIHEQKDGKLVLRWEVPIDVPFPMPAPIVIDGKLTRVPMPNGKAEVSVSDSAQIRVDPDMLVLRRTRAPRRR